MSLLELSILLKQLPPEALYRTAIRNRYSDDELAAMADELPEDAPHGQWSHLELLVATLIDAVQVLTHVQVARGGVQADAPKPLRRPGIAGRRLPAASRHMSEQGRAFLERIREQHRVARESE